MNFAWLNSDTEFRDERGVMDESDSVLKAIMNRQTAIVREIRDRLFIEGIGATDETFIHVRILM
ncbi:hypothetical protein DPMN_027994 [Dreissena polymorpha]|uniref:Uncharacterized protein n=1 Tax=Dreissena polymorpha TaxID=45954 RepID=A0A9D4RDZ0_DREPO|nr:hypothetical protein DPMN_027994 [Dreissena polymorpha]